MTSIDPAKQPNKPPPFDPDPATGRDYSQVAHDLADAYSAAARPAPRMEAELARAQLAVSEIIAAALLSLMDNYEKAQGS